VKLLVESPDIGPNSSDSDGLTPLSYAANWGREDLVEWFLEHNDINPDYRITITEHSYLILP